jgi:hypothetical protein
MINLGPINITEDELKVRLLAHGYELKKNNIPTVMWLKHLFYKDVPNYELSEAIPDELIKAYEELLEHCETAKTFDLPATAVAAAITKVRNIKARSGK